MKFRVEIIGIDPAPERVLQSSGQYIEGCRIWAKSHLEALPADARHANAEAVISRVDLVEVERITREVPGLGLREELRKFVDEMPDSVTSGKFKKELTEILERNK